MAICTYTYKGHLFESEYELDDFLLLKKQYEPILGDAVFSTSVPSVLAALTDIAKNSITEKQKYREWRKDKKLLYGEDGEISIFDLPYVGVNRFLSGLPDSNGNLLFPEFRADLYFERERYPKWAMGQYTDEEKATFGIDDDNPTKITDINQQKACRLKMEFRWSLLANIGTAIHTVLLLCFEKHGGKYNFEKSDDELEAFIKNKLENSFKRDNSYLEKGGDVVKLAIAHAKQLHKDLTDKFGKDLVYFPEFAVTQTAHMESVNRDIKLFGIIDLLIVDSSGKVHILDYKTSIHPYSRFSGVKEVAYGYLMAFYLRMLAKYGINVYGTLLLVSPIQVKDFRLDPDEEDSYIFDGIDTIESFVPINSKLPKNIWDKVDEYLPEPVNSNNLSVLNVSKYLELTSKWFPNYLSNKEITQRYVIKTLEKSGLLEPDENNVFTFRKYGANEGVITSTSESDFIKKVTQYLQSLSSHRLRLTSLVKEALKDGIRELSMDSIDLPTPIFSGNDIEWMNKLLEPYTDGGWVVEDHPDLELFGIIVLKTSEGLEPPMVDIIRVSVQILRNDYRHFHDADSTFKSRKSLLSTYKSDVEVLSKSGNLMAEAVNGNVELMETLLLLNLSVDLLGNTVGSIKVVNPTMGDGLTMSNELLLYCWNELNNTKDHVDVNNLSLNSSAGIKFATKYEIAAQKFMHIMNMGDLSGWKDEYAKFRRFKSCISIIDLAILGNTLEKINALTQLADELTGKYKSTHQRALWQKMLDKTYTDLDRLTEKHVDLYNSILIAINDLKGINFKLLLEDHDSLLESIMIFRDGAQGNYTGNPGNLTSDTLNTVTNLVLLAYQNIRDEITEKNYKVKKLVEDLKREKQFGIVKLSTFGNLASLYLNLYEDPDKVKDFRFKHIDRLLGAERAFLEYALDEINKNRFKGKTKELLEYMKKSGDPAYYRVPLAVGSMDSIASREGLMNMIEAKLRRFLPQNAWKIALEKLEGIMNVDSEYSKDYKSKSLVLYQMTNMFDKGESRDRLDYIEHVKNTSGIGYFEHNLETLLLKHMFAYSQLENIDAVFPMIKAAMIHLTIEGAMKNKPFSEDIKYYEEYIKNKILNLSIVEPKNLKFAATALVIKNAASKLTLAFSPVLMFYQPLLGLWQNISLCIRKPDGKNSFTFLHFVKAAKIVGGDLFKSADKDTLCSLINLVYALNDMDMNTYIDRISGAKRGMWNFDNLAMKFNTRPDYYNRLSIFLSLMMGDGCLEAHSIVNGKLVYDWKKDSRFSAFANKQYNHKDYNKQKALYYAMAQLFVIEHTKMPDGSEFEIKFGNDVMALPRAYTTKESESMKSLADDIYGYYAHEKKSLIMSTVIGSMWLLFKNYWSGKRNLYLAPGGVKLRGSWEHYYEVEKDSDGNTILDENGKPKLIYYYYLVDKLGNILFDEPPTTEKTIAPFYQWKGQWQEGIMLTLSDLLKSMYNNKSIIKGWKEKMNIDDEALRLCYRSNMKQLAYDFVMWTIIGSILGALLDDWFSKLKGEKKPKDRTFSENLGLSGANVAVMAVKNSFLDLNFVDSVGSPMVSWTPFMIEFLTRLIQNVLKTASGDLSIIKGIMNVSSATKQIKYLADTLEPEE